jgi:hypothetical protein
LALGSPPVLADTRAEAASVQNESVTPTVNGRQHALDLDPRITPTTHRGRSTLVAMAWGCLPACIPFSVAGPDQPTFPPPFPSPLTDDTIPVRVIASRARLYEFHEREKLTPY